MPIVTGHYTFNRRDLSAQADELSVRFVPQLVNNKNTVLMLYPNSEPSFEPSYVRYAVGMKFRQMLSDRTFIVAEGVGQIVVTGQRLIGMITDGYVGKEVLDKSAGKDVLKESAGTGSVYAFALDLDDCDPVEIKKNWRGKPVEALILSKEGQIPVFGIQVFSPGPCLFLLIKDDGQVIQTSLPAFLEHLTPEGRRNLQKGI